MMPRFVSKLPRGIRRLFRLPPTRERLIRDVDEEVSLHLELRADELLLAFRLECVVCQHDLREVYSLSLPPKVEQRQQPTITWTAATVQRTLARI